VVCGTPDGRKPLLAVIPSFDLNDTVVVAVLSLGSINEGVDVDFDPDPIK